MNAPRRRQVLQKAAGGVAGALGIASGAAALSPFPWYLWAGMFLASVPVILVWAVRSTPSPHLPISDLLQPPEEGNSIHVPPSRDLIVASAEYARGVYGSDALRPQELLAWWERNSWAFLVLRSARGEYLGHADVLPLAPDEARALAEGRITEAELPLEGILPPPRMTEARVLYLAGITVKDCGADVGKMRAAQLIGALAEYLKRVYGTQPLRLLSAVAATSDGERLLAGLGARIVAQAEARKDRHAYYEVPITAEGLRSVKARAGRRAAPAALEIGPPPQRT